MEKEQPFDRMENNDVDIEFSNQIEILTTDDERLKIIGEELSNDTGRAVLTKLFDGANNISKIASELNVSIALVSWHIQRLAKVGLVRISNIELSSKNKKVYHYTPTKLALIIIPKQLAESNLESKIVKTSLKKLYDRLLAAGIFVSSSVLMYFIEKTANPTRVIVSDPDISNSLNANSELLISLFVGALCTSVFMLARLKKR